jgi:hypothetical protein
VCHSGVDADERMMVAPSSAKKRCPEHEGGEDPTPISLRASAAGLVTGNLRPLEPESATGSVTVDRGAFSAS